MTADFVAADLDDTGAFKGFIAFEPAVLNPSAATKGFIVEPGSVSAVNAVVFPEGI